VPVPPTPTALGILDLPEAQAALSTGTNHDRLLDAFLHLTDTHDVDLMGMPAPPVGDDACVSLLARDRADRAGKETPVARK
jgi:hypothetical protein